MTVRINATVIIAHEAAEYTGQSDGLAADCGGGLSRAWCGRGVRLTRSVGLSRVDSAL